jgi:hypothetical protein
MTNATGRRLFLFFKAAEKTKLTAKIAGVLFPLQEC